MGEADSPVNKAAGPFFSHSMYTFNSLSFPVKIQFSDSLTRSRSYPKISLSLSLRSLVKICLPASVNHSSFWTVITPYIWTGAESL